jgi:hypothetical protein
VILASGFQPLPQTLNLLLDQPRQLQGLDLLFDNVRERAIVVSSEAEIPEEADAVMFCLRHDVQQSPGGAGECTGSREDRRIGRLESGQVGPVVGRPRQPRGVAGVTPCVTTYEGFDRPWRHLSDLIPDLAVRSLAVGGGYLARGTR